MYKQLCVCTPGAMSLCFCCSSCNLKADLAKYPSDCRRQRIGSRAGVCLLRGEVAVQPNYLGFLEELVVQHALAGFAQMRRFHCHAPPATGERLRLVGSTRRVAPRSLARNSRPGQNPDFRLRFVSN